jgi:hypothetical protein
VVQFWVFVLAVSVLFYVLLEACQAMLAAGSVGRPDWSHFAST